MIRDKQILKEELNQKMSKAIDQYVESIDEGFHRDLFPIDEIEKLWGEAIKECNTILKNGTEQMLNTINESEIISKKKTS